MMRRVLVVLLGLGMAVLSFDALRAYALDGRPLTDGVIPQATILPRPWLAMLWAVVVDLAVAAGILGVKDDRGDWRAWLMLLLALGATLGFQVFALSPFVARAVPPVGLALAILVLDLGPGKPKAAVQQRTPVPARLRAWLGSWEQPAPTPVVPGPVGPVIRARPAGQPRSSGLTLAQRRRVEGWFGEGRSARFMARELGLTNYARANHLAPLIEELQAARVGGPAENGERP
jgi:hypothetical protein